MFYVNLILIPALHPVGFEFINPARSGSNRLWKFAIRYIPGQTAGVGHSPGEQCFIVITCYWVC